MKKAAFTLAEVLITLAVIGVVAAIAVPTITQNIQNAELKVAYKKAFAVASQAWKLALAESSIEKVDRYTWGNSVETYRKNFLAFKSKISIMKDCPYGGSACWPATGEKWFNSLPYAGNQFVDSSGMIWADTGYNNDGAILVDVNGARNPNKLGRDRFEFDVNLLACEQGTDNPCLPVKVRPQQDFPNGNVNNCPSGECYATSWLKE